MPLPTKRLKSAPVALATVAALSLLGMAATATGDDTMADHPYVGMWVTDDGHIRHELLPNNRYDEARGERESAYQGRYRVTGNTIEYWDDTGFTADGEFIDGVLYHAGMVLRRKSSTR
ncbi:Atu4866 domain-containing protein [Halomonas sp. MCCC 1A17488]|nr:Atu4866 domain-containing protein [Halomonas sp. MCCC 1A17488]MCG3241031.1 Atu4866 domain-containing protein [Halomonas sp. MCCC 1A17488]QPP48895.1 Atu4866 domain-containing protein [Halomonas sp. SS10-MC5]